MATFDTSIYGWYGTCNAFLRAPKTMADPGGPVPPFLDFFFLQKRSLPAKLVLNEYESCLKMLEMAILETQIFKKFHVSF